MSEKSARILALGLLLCILPAPFLLIPGSTAKADGAEVSAATVGTWIVHVVPPAISGVPAYDSLSTFSAGGTLVVSPDPSFPGLRTSTGHGAWRQTGNANTFSSSHWGIAYSPAGAVVLTFKINSSFVTHDDTFEGQGQLQVCDPQFANCISPVPPGQFAQLTGKRVSVPIQ